MSKKTHTEKWVSNFRLKCGGTGICTYILTLTDEGLLGATLESAALDGPDDDYLTKDQEKELAQMVAVISSTLASSMSNEPGLSEQQRIR